MTFLKQTTVKKQSLNDINANYEFKRLRTVKTHLYKIASDLENSLYDRHQNFDKNDDQINNRIESETAEGEDILNTSCQYSDEHAAILCEIQKLEKLVDDLKADDLELSSRYDNNEQSESSVVDKLGSESKYFSNRISLKVNIEINRISLVYIDTFMAVRRGGECTYPC